MSSRAELIGKLEAMRVQLRSAKDDAIRPASSKEQAYQQGVLIGQLWSAVDALTFVVIGMLEAEGPCGNQDVTGRTCARKTNHEHHHRSRDGWIW